MIPLTFRPLLAGFGALALLLPGVARAECGADNDCKGDRVCEQGVCVDPKPSAPAALPAPPRVTALSQADVDALGRARSLGRAGMWIGIAGAPFALGAALLNGSGDLPILLGGVAAASVGAAVPVGMSGGSVARAVGKQHGIRVSTGGLRPVVWIGYGCTLAAATGMITIGILDGYVPTELILSTTALGTVTAIGTSIDASSAARQVEAAVGTAAAETATPPVTVVLVPTGNGVSVIGTF